MNQHKHEAGTLEQLLREHDLTESTPAPAAAMICISTGSAHPPAFDVTRRQIITRMPNR